MSSVDQLPNEAGKGLGEKSIGIRLCGWFGGSGFDPMLNIEFILLNSIILFGVLRFDDEVLNLSTLDQGRCAIIIHN